MAEIYRALVADRTRLEQIVDDVLTPPKPEPTSCTDHLGRTPQRHHRPASGRRKGGHRPQRRHQARERRQIADQLANPHARFGSAPDRRHQLVHRRRLRLPRSRHTGTPTRFAGGERSTHPRLGRRPHSSSTATAGPMAIRRPDDAGAHTSRPGSMSASDARRDSISSLL
jgi:hypothetical protein